MAALQNSAKCNDNQNSNLCKTDMYIKYKRIHIRVIIIRMSKYVHICTGDEIRIKTTKQISVFIY